MNRYPFRNDVDYWAHKLACYLHDPPDKALHIPGHESRSALLTDMLSLPTPDKDLYHKADCIAAGLDRTLLPGYNSDPEINGAVNFLEHPVLTHPTGHNEWLRLNIKTNQKEVFSGIQTILKEDLVDESTGFFNNTFQGQQAAYGAASFHYIHHVLRERLAVENIGGLGGAWYRLPADTRMPDHSIWQHCGLVSALSSCFRDSVKKDASLVVFSISPVQDFIGKARKLRDFWVGSLILSWLAFEGMRSIIYEYGSDHILYPSVMGQPFIEWLLSSECGMNWFESKKRSYQTDGIASLPNKFVFLAPAGKEEECVKGVCDSIQHAWENMGSLVLTHIEACTRKKDLFLFDQFNRQISEYWKFDWAASPLIVYHDDSHLQDNKWKALLDETVYKEPCKFYGSKNPNKKSNSYPDVLYSVSHSLAQAYLASGKLSRKDDRPDENGIKCGLHGEYEILHFGKDSGKNPRPTDDAFWSLMKNNSSDFKDTERLCAIATLKRLLPQVLRKGTDVAKRNPLHLFFKNAEVFPSTTEMALSDWLDRVESHHLNDKLGKNWRSELASIVHEDETDGNRPGEFSDINPEVRKNGKAIIAKMARHYKDPIKNDDKYYGILMMDGDHMGKLINGQTIAARWQDVLHPELIRKFQEKDYQIPTQDFWKDKTEKTRLLSPATHAAVSEALGDFSLYTVPEIIRSCRGKLIYAGGDDVCAVLPVSTAVMAAHQIAKAYSSSFVYIDQDNSHIQHRLSDSWLPQNGRLSLHLGKGKDITISAGILLVHHKRPLSGALRRAHELLNIAKKAGGRNAIAIELEKRAGGGRLFLSKWDDPPANCLGLNTNKDFKGVTRFDCFQSIGVSMNHSGRPDLSRSLTYRLSSLKPGMEAILKYAPARLPDFIKSQVLRSGDVRIQKNSTVRILSEKLCALIVNRDGQINTDAPIIAGFIGAQIERSTIHHGGAG